MEVVSTLVFYVNGCKVRLGHFQPKQKSPTLKIVDSNVDPEFTLIQYLRQKLQLCGTKLGCSEGGCGACTVMVSRYNPIDDVIEHISVNACLFPIAATHGAAVTTVEGIGSTKTTLHPVQEAIANAHGTQCGFCTPGFVMSMYTLLRNNPSPTIESIRNSFQGNLCRCTGYRPILEGFRYFSKEASSCCGARGNGQCCQTVNGNNETNKIKATGLFNDASTRYDPTQEIIFPPELKLLASKYDSQHLIFGSERVTWIRPTSLTSLLALKSEFKDAQLVVGNTEIGISTTFKNMSFPKLIAVTAIPELKEVICDDTGITFGAAITLSVFERLLREAIKNKPESETKIFVAVRNMLMVFAENQIRNVASIAGNIVTASPISDLNPLFLASNCVLKVASKDGPQRLVKMDSRFFAGYRKTVLKPEEVVISIHIPFTDRNEHFFGYKQSRRREDDMPIVNAGMMVQFRPDANVIEQLRIAYGGMASRTVYASKTMTSLIGRNWDDSIVDSACKLLAEDLPLDPSAPGGMVRYRQTLATSFFFKFYLQVLDQIKSSQVLTNIAEPSHARSDVTPIERKVPKSSQLFQVAPSGQPAADPIGRPEVHKAAFQHASGEAVYCDDIPQYQHELHLGLVTSTHAHAKILSIDATEALALQGIVAFYCHTDIPPERNVYIVNEEIFASKVVSFHGQTIGALVGKDANTVRRASQLVKVEYEDVTPVVVTLEDAIRNGNILKEHDLMIGKGDIEKGFLESENVLEGEIRIGAQEHFYMEPQGALAVPRGEAGEITVFSATQNPSGLQHQLAEVLNLPANRIVVQVKRLGGGFGGKEIRSQIPAVPCAIAAQRLNRPIRCIMRRDDDMASTGTRHPFLARYKVGFSSDGKIIALDVAMHANIGFSLDLSPFIMARAVHHVENAYLIPHMRVSGHLYTSNTSSCTAFRGSGGPQGMLIAEMYMDHVAAFLQIDPAKIRELNLYREGDVTQYTQVIPTDALLQCWKQCTSQSDYLGKQRQVKQFNRENRWKKRGIAMTPTKFGVSFVVVFLIQGSALVNVYQDGSVLLSHGGVEMGQGLHTKMIQVASRVLEISSDKIHICETSTDKVPNASTTGASLSSDLNGYAVMYACQTIKERLAPIVSENPEGSWENWIKAAYMQRISLSATGFYKTNEEEYSYETNTGIPYHYFTNGVACTEVEIDCLTGHHQVLSTDIVMDVGQSINPAIDIGQIEGGFIQGYGMFTLEELRHSSQGYLYTRGPGTYKIPTISDIPIQFNVSLLKGSSCQRAIYSSKAIGEPPFFLAASAFFALKDAIRNARKEVGIEGHFTLDSPATSERIRMACTDQFTDQFPVADPKTFSPWSVMA